MLINIGFRMSIPGVTFFTRTNSRLSLTALGVTRLIAKATGRPTFNTWHASRLAAGPLRTRLEQDITNLRNQIGFPASQGAATDHHIFPGNSIGQMLREALGTANGVTVVNNYINSRAGITNMLNSHLLRTTPDQENAIDDVFTAVFWYEFNLVIGPSVRFNDPG
jgi:hypothetical protein